MIPNENPALPGAQASPGESKPAERAQNSLHLMTPTTEKKSCIQGNNLKIKIATINIQSFTEKETKLIKTMIKRNLYVLGLCETKLTKKAPSELTDGYRLVHKGEVGFILSPEAKERLRGVHYKTKNIICVDLGWEHTDLSIIQVYVPDATKSTSERKNLYEALQDVYNLKKYQDNVILMGDFNGHVGKKREGIERIIGPFSIGKINNSGKRINEFCAFNSLSVMNTFFMHAEEFKWTWYRVNEVANEKNEKSEIDFMISRNKYLFRDVKAIPYLSYKSSHRMVVAKLSVKKPHQLTEPKKIFKLENLNREDCVNLLNRKVSIRMPRGNVERDIEEEWDFMKKRLNDLAKKVLTEKVIYRTKRKNASWWSNDLRKFNTETWNTIGKDLEDNMLSTKLLLYSMTNYVKGGSPPWYTVGEGDTDNYRQVIPRRWEEYFEALLNIKEDALNDDEAEDNIVSDMEISIQETEKAIKCMNSGLAPGKDNLPVELFKNIGTDGAKWLTYVCNIAWKQEEIPSDWRRAIIAPIYRTVENMECGSYMGITILSHGGKVYERILEQKLRAKVEKKLGDWQHGFRPNRHALDIIFSMKMVIEKSWEWKQSKYLAFIAFDCIPREQYWKALNHKAYNIDPKLIKVIQSLYRHWDDREVKFEDANMPVGIYQCGVLSPLLTIIFMDWCLQEICPDQEVRTFVHAGDVAIMTDTKESLQDAIDRWRHVMTQKKVTVNKTKTVVMHVGRETEECNIRFGDDKLRQVNQVKFLGVVFNRDNTQECEIENRIQRYNTNEKLLKPLLTDKKISQELKVKLYASILRPTLIYGCESWAVTKPSERKINGAEIDVLKTIYNGTKQRNENELRRDLKVTPISNIIEQKKLLWYGQIQRMEDTMFPKRFLRWIPPGIRPRGGSRKRWSLGIKAALMARGTNMKEVERKKIYQNPKEWTKLVHQRKERNTRARSCPV